jgi:cell division protein FtsQ
MKSGIRISREGNLIVNIKEKQPIIRIYEEGKPGYYIDNKGDIFPISSQFAPRVIIANGYINDNVDITANNINDSTFTKSVAKELYNLTQLINDNDLLAIQINQIYVNSKGEYDLIPELGNHIIKFGTFDNAKDKLNNLTAYYARYLKTNNWDSYKSINLTYKDQIVCTKK